MCHFYATFVSLIQTSVVTIILLICCGTFHFVTYSATSHYMLNLCHISSATCATCRIILTFILILLAMKYCVALLSLFLATVYSLQNSTTTTTTTTTIHTSATTTQNSVSFTVKPYSSGIPSSSVPPSSSVTPSHSPSIPPTPQPLVDKCYTLNETRSNQSCVKLCVYEPIRFLSNYTDANNKTKNSTVTIPDPWNVTISGLCPVSLNGKFDRSAMSLQWHGYSFSFTFLYNKKNNGDGKLALDKWFLESATFMKENENNYTRNVTKNDTDTIVSDVRRAYTCDTPFILELYPELYPEQKNVTGTWLNMTRYTIQPFALNLTDFSFQFLDSCEPSGIPLFVPIIVAGILGLFVLVLLFLYVIGRFRLKKKGEYERLT